MIELILEIKDNDTVKALEALSEVGIVTRVRSDEEATWLGDSLLQALFELSEMSNEMDEEMLKDVPMMVSELEWFLFEDGNTKLSLINGLRKEFFASYVREKVIERNNEMEVTTIFMRRK